MTCDTHGCNATITSKFSKCQKKKALYNDSIYTNHTKREESERVYTVIIYNNVEWNQTSSLRMNLPKNYKFKALVSNFHKMVGGIVYFFPLYYLF